MPIVNAYERSMEVVPGTRILLETFSLIGTRFRDQHEVGRTWTVIGAFKPMLNRPNHGARVRVMDGHGIVSFISHRDLELLAQRAKPGELCPYTQEAYPEVGDEQEGWLGLYMDEEDIADDLHIRELELRQQFAQETGVYGILPEIDLTRRLHTSTYRDVERLDVLMFDYDPETGVGPDVTINGLHHRWKCVQQEALTWRDL